MNTNLDTNTNTNLDTTLEPSNNPPAVPETPDPQLALLETIADTMNVIANRLEELAQQRSAQIQNAVGDGAAEERNADNSGVDGEGQDDEGDIGGGEPTSNPPDNDESGPDHDYADAEPADDTADYTDDDLGEDEGLDDLMGGLDEFMDDINQIMKDIGQAAIRPWGQIRSTWSTRAFTAPTVTAEPAQSGDSRDKPAGETADSSETQTRRYRRGPYRITITRRLTTR